MSDIYLRIAGHLIAVSGGNSADIIKNPQFVNFKSRPELTEDVILIKKKYRPVLGIIEFYGKIEGDICYKMYRLSSVEFCMNVIDTLYDNRVSLYFNSDTRECTIGGGFTNRFHSIILWVAYNLLVANKETFSIKSSSVICGSRSVLFLSNDTSALDNHIGFWEKNIIGAKYYCHDYSIVRIEQRGIYVFSSPWSNSGELNQQNEIELKAIVRYDAKSVNTVRRLSTTKAISVLYPFCNPVFGFEKKESNITGKFLTSLFRRTPIYQVECSQSPESIQKIYETILDDNIYFE